jgi:hypothetical protein
MNTATTNSPIQPARSLEVFPHAIPSLDELYEMTAEPEERSLIRGVAWAFYEQLVDSIPEGVRIYVDYDGKDLEIMTLGQIHDGLKKLLGQLVEAIAQELEIPYKSSGQTPWKRPEVARGLEADESYFFRPEKLIAMAQAKPRRSRKIAE